MLFNTLNYAREGIVLNQQGIIVIPRDLKNKIGSGILELQISQKIREKRLAKLTTDGESIWIVIYSKDYPTNEQISELTDLDVNIYLNTWTPPLSNHPFGFFLANLPVEKTINLLSFEFVQKIETAEIFTEPHNNNAYKAIKADDVWSAGYDGSNVKIIVMDSGLDLNYMGTDLPNTFDRKDYSDFPNIDDNINNTVTGHGTHVTGSVLGRGLLSTNNIGNGAGPYKGIAPGSNLVFLKIGNDTNGNASYASIISAFDAAVNIYNADIITMSYGGWSVYHDGSGSLDQKVDWCYNKGVPVFISAGNEANKDRHYSGIVGQFSETDYIGINVSSATSEDTKLQFNLVWYDGQNKHIDLTLKYFDSNFNELTNITRLTTTESVRGTEHQISYYNIFLPEGNSIYYVKVENNSDQLQGYHIYEDWNNGKVKFLNSDPDYTIGSPSTADHAFSVAAWTSRYQWTAWDGSGPYPHSSNNEQIANDICTFSSRGPRVDGLQKPNISAPGYAIISLRDTDYYTNPRLDWIDNDGNTDTGDKNYIARWGTSMACPMCAGAAALLLEKNPLLTPNEVYYSLNQGAIMDTYTGACPNNTWGYGKLNIYDALYVDLTNLRKDISNLMATPSQNLIEIVWENPDIPQFSGVMFVKEENGPIGIIPTDGINYQIGELIGPHEVVCVTSSESFIDNNVQEGNTYYYKGFSYNQNYEYSSGVQVSCTFEIESASLKNEDVEPYSGNSNDLYTFEVTYRDPPGEPPSLKRIYIDNNPHNMEYIEGDYTSGADYQYTTTNLFSGQHSYRFHFKDSRGNDLYHPSSGSFSGPVIDPPTPTFFFDPEIDQVADQSLEIRWESHHVNFVDLYYDTDNNDQNGGLILIQDNVPNNDIPDQSGYQETGEYVWDTSNIPDGHFFLYGIADNGVRFSRYSQNMIEINHSIYLPIHNWLPTHLLSPAGSFPRIAIDNNANPHIVYENNHIYYVRSTDQGRTWETPVRIDNSTGNCYKPDITVDNLNNIHIVWEDQRGPFDEVYYTKSTNNGLSWPSDNLMISDDNSKTSDFPRITFNTQAVHIIWKDIRDGKTQIFYSKSIVYSSRRNWNFPPDLLVCNSD